MRSRRRQHWVVQVLADLAAPLALIIPVSLFVVGLLLGVSWLMRLGAVLFVLLVLAVIAWALARAMSMPRDVLLSWKSMTLMQRIGSGIAVLIVGLMLSVLLVAGAALLMQNGQ